MRGRPSTDKKQMIFINFMLSNSSSFLEFNRLLRTYELEKENHFDKQNTVIDVADRRLTQSFGYIKRR